MAKIRKREEQRTEDTWDLERIYPTEEAWEEDAKWLEKEMEAFERHQGTLNKGAGNLLQILEDYCAMGQILGKLYAYASMRLDENTADSRYQKLEGRARNLATGMDSVCAWMEPEILALDAKVLERYLEEEEGLRVYRVFLEEIQRKKAHTLSGDRERILARAFELGSAPGRIYAMFQNADLTFETVKNAWGEEFPLTQETFVPLEESRDRQVRKDAFEKFYRGYSDFGNTLAALYDANVRQCLFFARERRYDSALEAALDQSQIPVPVYGQLIDTVRRNLPKMHRYAALRKRALGVDELHMYDVYVPMVKDVTRKYSFEEAKQIVLEGLAPLGEEYQSLLRQGMEQRWIDVYENEGKRCGAYSGGSYWTMPYVLLNYQGSLNHVFTLAHELGHSVHSYYTRQNQPYIYGDYRIFVAEVASTCNEVLLMRSLLEKTEEPRERAYLINYFLEQFKSTLYRQTMFAEFEKITHERVQEGGTLNAETLCGIYRDLNQSYFGDAMAQDPQIAWEWARIPHFYRPFYVYQYATGFSAAMAISKKIWDGEPGAVEKYKRFLQAGSSLSPIELLKLCDVDMTRPEPVQDALDLFGEYLGKFEKVVDKTEAI